MPKVRIFSIFYFHKSFLAGWVRSARRVLLCLIISWFSKRYHVLIAQSVDFSIQFSFHVIKRRHIVREFGLRFENYKLWIIRWTFMITSRIHNYIYFYASRFWRMKVKNQNRFQMHNVHITVFIFYFSKLWCHMIFVQWCWVVWSLLALHMTTSFDENKSGHVMIALKW